jgi:oxaloacetate decarboxylase alpha subunit
LLANVGGMSATLEVDEGNGTGLIRVKVDDREYVIDATNPAPGLYSLLVRGKVYQAAVWQRRGRREVQVGQLSTSVEIVPERSQRPSVKSTAVVAGRQEVTAPMAGRVVQVLVQPGQSVSEGDSLVVIEAMKMETEIRATGPGHVSIIQVNANTIVDAGQLLVVIEA